ncbi:hypothetical protein HYW66_01210 [Candidatus Microgenomates bacterium]|nr:hypothetical protein [Candidatus Microgenomates bacterium]
MLPEHRTVFSEKRPIVRLLPGEKILLLQRQHWIIIVMRALLDLLIFVVALGIALAFLVQQTIAISFSLVIAMLLFITAFILVHTVFSFFFWYYQFYIITNKCLIHVHFFRVGGYHFDEVFLEKTPMREIDTNPPNIFFDLLNLDDVYVYFQRLERPEPFIFKTPSDAQAIEDLLEDLTAK